MDDTVKTAAEMAADAPVVLDRMVTTLVMAFVFISMLGSFGVQTASLIAVLGAASLAIGLALQGSLSNFASGVMPLLLRPFRVGDYVEVAGEAGRAIEVIRDVVKADASVLPEPAPTIAVAELGDSSVNLVVRPWVDRADYWNVRFDLIQGLKNALDAAGIEIPFPQRVVTMVQAK